jgi:hypothetical protein
MTLPERIIVPIAKVKNNAKNPRVVKDYKFEQLKKSIEDFPDMLAYRMLVCNTDKDGKYVVLGGNQRLKAMKDLGYKEVPIMLADEWTEEQKAAFIIKDNSNFGEWDFDMLKADGWDFDLLSDWGVDMPDEWGADVQEIDYSILDEQDVSEQLQEMSDGVKKAIQIEFDNTDYVEAYDLVKFWREKGAYVGGMIMEYLKNEKGKI